MFPWDGQWTRPVLLSPPLHPTAVSLPLRGPLSLPSAGSAPCGDVPGALPHRLCSRTSGGLHDLSKGVQPHSAWGLGRPLTSKLKPQTPLHPPASAMVDICLALCGPPCPPRAFAMQCPPPGCPPSLPLPFQLLEIFCLHRPSEQHTATSRRWAQIPAAGTLPPTLSVYRFPFLPAPPSTRLLGGSARRLATGTLQNTAASPGLSPFLPKKVRMKAMSETYCLQGCVVNGNTAPSHAPAPWELE